MHINMHTMVAGDYVSPLTRHSTRCSRAASLVYGPFITITTIPCLRTKQIIVITSGPVGSFTAKKQKKESVAI